jgi:hypothetical protein
MGEYVTETIVSSIIIGSSALYLEWLFVRCAKIERSDLSAIVCPLIAYILIGMMHGLVNGGSFAAAYFHHFSGLGVVLLMMLAINALRLLWRKGRRVKRFPTK